MNNDNDQKFYEEFKLLEVRGHVLISWDRIPNYEKIWNIKLEFIWKSQIYSISSRTQVKKNMNVQQINQMLLNIEL